MKMDEKIRGVLLNLTEGVGKIAIKDSEQFYESSKIPLKNLIDIALTAIKKIFLAEIIARLPMRPIYNEEGHSNEDNERDIGYNEHRKEIIKLLGEMKETNEDINSTQTI